MYLKNYGELRVKTNISRKFIQFSSKQGCFLHALLLLIHGRTLSTLYSRSRCEQLAGLKELMMSL